MMKKWFVNSASNRSKIRRLCVGGGERKTVPDGEVLTVAQLVAMTRRGQDINVYARPVVWGSDSEEPDHDQVDLDSFMRMDFADRSEFAREHGERVVAIGAEIKALVDSENRRATPSITANKPPGRGDENRPEPGVEAVDSSEGIGQSKTV